MRKGHPFAVVIARTSVALGWRANLKRIASVMLVAAAWGCAASEGGAQTTETPADKRSETISSSGDRLGPLFDAMLMGHFEKTSALIEQGADVNERGVWGDTVLILAVWHGNSEIVKILLEHGVNVNAKNDIGETALFWAVPKPEIAELLLNAGAQVNVRNAQGTTPLMYAALLGFHQTVNLLLEHGARVNEKNLSGDTALLFTARPTDLSMKEFRLCESLYKEASATSIAGGTGRLWGCVAKEVPHHGAVTGLYQGPSSPRCDYPYCTVVFIQNAPGIKSTASVEKTLSLLIAHGTDVKTADGEGKTALDYATERNDTAIINLLSKARLIE